VHRPYGCKYERTPQSRRNDCRIKNVVVWVNSAMWADARRPGYFATTGDAAVAVTSSSQACPERSKCGAFEARALR
jgi:hypothetical protein